MSLLLRDPEACHARRQITQMTRTVNRTSTETIHRSVSACSTSGLEHSLLVSLSHSVRPGLQFTGTTHPWDGDLVSVTGGSPNAVETPQTDTSRKRTPPVSGHLPQTDTSRKRTPPVSGHLPQTDTSRKRTPPVSGHLPQTDTSRKRTPPVSGHLP